MSAPTEARGVVPPPGRAAPAADIPSAGFIVAALYVEKSGAYYDLAGVDPWDVDRDARTYAGPYPVVAHPPCERWGRFWNGGMAWRGAPKQLGDDGGCFAAALAAVRRWGGVLEHPAGSLAWREFGLLTPPERGWGAADWQGGWTCRVDQGHYGHPARKPTWLYAVGAALPALRWGASAPEIPADRSDKWRARAARDGVCVLLSRRQRAATPQTFRDLLISIAQSAQIPSQDGDPARVGTARGLLSLDYPGRVANDPGPAGGFSA